MNSLKNNPLWVILLILILCSVSELHAQQLPAGTEKTVIDGVEYYLYKVQKSEGLYRISINTQVSQEEIVKINPEAAIGLKEGQILKIPVLNSKKQPVVESTQSSQIAKNDSSSAIIHTVATKETLYGISKSYGITINELLQENPGVINGQIQPGMQLRIPAKGQAQSKNWTKHEVQQGETFYSIARKYKIAGSDLREANPGIDESNINPGMTLTIPIEANDNANKWQKVLNERPYTVHEVGKKETLFGICRQYNITEQQLKEFNPQMELGNLQKGDHLKVPTKQWLKAINDSIEDASKIVEEPLVVPSNYVDCHYNYFEKRETIKIAILLPFNSSGNKTNTSTDNEDDSSTSTTEYRSIPARSKVVLEFYEGFLMALESFKKKGVNFQLMVFDTTDDIEKLNQILNKPELATADLIVGPAHAGHIKAVSDFSKLHAIKMVNPFTTTNPELNNNPHLFQVTPIDSLLWDRLAQKVAAEGAGKRVILIKSTNPQASENSILHVFRNQITLFNSNHPTKTELVEHIYGQAENGHLTDKLVADQENIIFIPSIDELFVSKVIASLEGLVNNKTYPPITLYGMNEWLRFQNIEVEGIHKLNTHLLTYFGINYQDANTQSILSNYRELYRTEPYAFMPYFQKPSANGGYSRYGLWGYDVATWFVEAMVQFGPNFEQCSNQVNVPLAQSNFNFKRISNWGGFYNNGLIDMHFNTDYSISVEKVTP